MEDLYLDDTDRKAGFADALKNGRDTRPEKAWNMVVRYLMVEIHGRDDYLHLIDPVFGLTVYGILKRWPTEEDFRPGSPAAEILVKGWLKMVDGVLRQPRDKYSEIRDSFYYVFAGCLKAHLLRGGDPIAYVRTFESLKDEYGKFEQELTR